MFHSYLANRTHLLRWLGWFYFGNAIIFWLFGTYYFHGITPLSINLITHLNAALVWMYLFTTWIGYFALLAFLSSLFPLLLLFFCSKDKVITITAILCSSCALFALLIDMLVYGQYHFHLNSIFLAMVFSHEMNQIFDFTWLEKLLITSILIAILLIETIYAKWLGQFLQKNNRPLFGKTIATHISLCLFFSYNMFLLSSVQPTSIIYQQPQSFPLYTDIIMKVIPDFKQLPDFNNLGSDIIRQPQQTIYQKLNYPLHPLNCLAPTQPLNIIIIAIDTWRFDMLNKLVTPNIQQFAQQSWQFNNNWSGGNTTQPGIFSLFYGIPATYWTATQQQHKSPVLINELLQNHYNLGIFASASLTLPAFNKTVFSNVSHLQIITKGILPADRDQMITQEFKNFIDQTQKIRQPFFSFLFYDTAHSYCTDFPQDNIFLPIVHTCNRLDLNPGKDAPLYINRYKNALLFDDKLVEQDINELQKYQLLKNTVVIITADHGNEFDDNHQGYWGHGSNFTQYQVRTPLIIYWPDQKPQIFNQQTSHYDIVPTLLTNVFGCRNTPLDYSIGRVLPTTEPSLPFVITNSYIDFGVIQPTRITTIYHSGIFEITDKNNNIIASAKPDMKALSKAFKLLTLYY